MTADRGVLRFATVYATGGLCPIPIPPGRKGPNAPGWPELRITPADLPHGFTEEGNVGLLVGAPSGVQDVDIDCAEALALAPRFLPATDMISGRDTNPGSHWWYRPDATSGTEKWVDPTGPKKNATLVELRGTGGQTMVPPSVHPETGELVRWERSGDPARPALADLQRAVRRLAAAALLARHWPGAGARHDASLALCGALARARWTEDAIADFVGAVASYANRDDGEPGKRRGQARDSIHKLAAGDNVTGLPKLSELGVPEAVCTAAVKWLELPAFVAPAARAEITASTADMAAFLGVDLVARNEQAHAEQAKQGNEHAPALAVARVLGALVADRPAAAHPIRWYSTGIPELDALIGGGLGSGKLLVVCGPPGDGKSAWAISTAIHLEPTLPSLIASTELERDELRARVAGHLLDRPWTAVERGDVPALDVDAALASRRIRIVGCDDLPREVSEALQSLALTASTMATEHGAPPLVIVDYLQDLVRDGDDKSIRARVGAIATALRQLAQQLDSPMIAVSSVSRAFYSESRRAILRKSGDARDYLSAAKDSGDVDYAAASILFLDVEVERVGELFRLARIAVAKARRGRPGGFAGAKFHGGSGRWEATPEAVALMSLDDRAARVVDEAVAKLVTKVAEWLAAGTYKTKSQLRDSAAVPRMRQVLDRALEVGALEIRSVTRMEGFKPQTRECVVPRGHVAPDPLAPRAPEVPSGPPHPAAGFLRGAS